MAFPEKVDVLQGIAGVLTLVAVLLGPPRLFAGVTVDFTTGAAQYIVDWTSVITYGVVLPILGLTIILMREEGGLDLFATLLVVFTIGGLVTSLPQILQSTPTGLSLPSIIRYLILPVIGIGLILEAFDVIKPIKT